MIAAKVLMSAKTKIEKGWCQGYLKRRGCYCTYGAIIYSTVSNKASQQAIKAFLEANKIRDCITTWNDNQDRTQAEVLAAFDKAIELAEKQ